MRQALPYLSIDDDFNLNYSLVVLILHKLSLSTKNNAVLDFEKIQIFLYLTKNPSRINPILNLAGKKNAPIRSQYTYTIESLSTNVDILFDRAKLKYLLRELAARGMLSCVKGTEQEPVKFLLSEKGESFAYSLIGQYDPAMDFPSLSPLMSEVNYFSATLEVITSLVALQSQSTNKLHSYLNTLFKRN